MAKAGTSYFQTVAVTQQPEQVVQQLAAATAGASGYTVSSAGATTLILTRKYTPTWAIVVAIIGLLFFLVGLLALLVKTTETLTIAAAATGDGTQITISGAATAEMASRLNAAISGLTGAPASPTGELGPSGS